MTINSLLDYLDWVGWTPGRDAAALEEAIESLRVKADLYAKIAEDLEDTDRDAEADQYWLARTQTLNAMHCARANRTELLELGS
ncbi:MAG: hypothetical protein HQL47_05405 [Gammaproteobacteria bacterium]|nr:hypothetical protein [Gammaproteobacteria bacterium]